MSRRADADPSITVVVPAYNAAETVARTLDSLVAQTFRDFEVVVVDDASNDTTCDVAQNYADRLPGLRFVRREKNSGGVGAPRNDGVRAARGTYVMFLDSDDELPAEACEVLVEGARKAGADITSGQTLRVNHGRGSVKPWQPELYAAERSVAGIGEWVELLNDPIAAAKLYKRDFLVDNDIFFPEGLFYEDTYFSVKAYHLARGISVLPVPVYHWIWEDRQGAGASITNRRNEIRSVRDRIAVHRLADAYLRESGALELKLHKDLKFLRHDTRLYMKELRHADAEYRAEFSDLVSGYLAAEVEEAAFSRSAPLDRVRSFYLRHGLIDAALTVADFEQRRGVLSTDLLLEDGRVYWSAAHLDLPQARVFLDVTELGLHGETFENSRMFNRATSVEVVGRQLRITGEIPNQFGHIGSADRLDLIALTRSKGRGRRDAGRISEVRVSSGVITYEGTLGLRGLFADFPDDEALNLQVRLEWQGRKHTTAVSVRGLDLGGLNAALRATAVEAYGTASGNLAFRRAAVAGGKRPARSGWRGVKDRLLGSGHREG